MDRRSSRADDRVVNLPLGDLSLSDLPLVAVESPQTMPACSSLPNRPPPEVLDRLTKPKSPEREREMEKLRQAIVEPRKNVDEIFSRGQSLVELRTCELAIPKLEAGAILRQEAK